MKTTVNYPQQKNALSHELEESLSQFNYWFCSGGKLSRLPFYRSEDWQAFSDCWNRLELDNYMGDNGVYRYRRYGSFRYISEEKRLELQPHQSYSQPSTVNKLNGGIKRNYEPLESTFINHEFLRGLLTWCASTFNLLIDLGEDWDIKLHPYRILAMEGEVGCPTPEGLHRDGVDYILTLMINRHNVVGGETTITDESGKVLWQRQLLEPLDIVIEDDVRTRHIVTPIERSKPNVAGHRDVLVIAFARL